MLTRRTLALLLLLTFLPTGCGGGGAPPAAPNASEVKAVAPPAPYKEERAPGVVAGKMAKKARPLRTAPPNVSAP
jgi:hypothetical protein